MIKREVWSVVLLLFATCSVIDGFISSPSLAKLPQSTVQRVSVSFATSAATSSSADASEVVEQKKLKREKQREQMKLLREQGGPFTFNTPVGALNPFAIYYGLLSIFLGIPWFISLKLTQLLYFLTRGRFDKKVSDNTNRKYCI